MKSAKNGIFVWYLAKTTSNCYEKTAFLQICGFDKKT